MPAVTSWVQLSHILKTIIPYSHLLPQCVIVIWAYFLNHPWVLNAGGVLYMFYLELSVCCTIIYSVQIDQLCFPVLIVIHFKKKIYDYN